MKNLLLQISTSTGYFFLALCEFLWGIWYLNPVVSHYIHVHHRFYFEPPFLLGLSAVALGGATLINLWLNAAHRTTSRWLFRVYHIIFWSYVTISLGINNLAGSGLPIYIVMSLAAISFYVLDSIQRYESDA